MTDNPTCPGCGAPLIPVTERWPLDPKRCRECRTVLPLFLGNEART